MIYNKSESLGMLESTHSVVDAPAPVRIWSAAQFPEHQRYDAWANALSSYFLPWSITSCGQRDCSATVRQFDLGGCKLIHCETDPLSGVRTLGDIGRTDGDFFNVLYIVSGVEYLRFHDREVALRAGEYVLWDSRRRIEFSLAQPLEKLTLMVPAQLMHSMLPNANDYVGMALSCHQGIGGLFASHLRALGQAVWDMRDHDAAQVLNPTLELLTRALASVPCRRRPTVRQVSLQRIREHILAHLPDPDLSPGQIAAAKHISVRYLHMLFEGTDTTVSDWIRAQRLEHCRADLSNIQLTHLSITEIAYKWGFADSGNFGKAFRRAFGESPRAFRRARLGNTIKVLDS